jgi:hypothetical protein
MPPRFVAELMTQKTARYDHQLLESQDDPKKRESKHKSYVARRKVEMMKRLKGTSGDR